MPRKIVRFDKKIIRTRRRSLALQVRTDGTLVVRAPHFLKDSLIDRFIEQKQAWITKVTLRMEERERQQRRYEFREGGLFLFLGREYPLSIGDDPAKARRIFEKWYKKEAHRVITQRCQHYAPLMGVRYRSLSLSSAKSRWGCCTPHGNLRFCWRLVMAPIEVIDYVVVHELAHLKELNHSPRFWSHVSAMLPDHPKTKQWLKEHGHELSW